MKKYMAAQEIVKEHSTRNPGSFRCELCIPNPQPHDLGFLWEALKEILDLADIALGKSWLLKEANLDEILLVQDHFIDATGEVCPAPHRKEDLGNGVFVYSNDEWDITTSSNTVLIKCIHGLDLKLSVAPNVEYLLLTIYNLGCEGYCDSPKVLIGGFWRQGFDLQPIGTHLRKTSS